MRNLPLLLALLLLSVLLAAASAQADPVPVPDQMIPLVNEDEAESEDEEPESEEEESGECVIEDEEDVQLCAEIAREERELAKAEREREQCALESAKASIAANPGKRRLRLTVHYKTLKPSAVTVTASLRGTKGALLLGTDHARFHRSGVYRDTFTLAEKQVKKALGARELSVDLHAVNTPPSCRLHLTAHKGGARKLSWS